MVFSWNKKKNTHTHFKYGVISDFCFLNLPCMCVYFLFEQCCCLCVYSLFRPVVGYAMASLRQHSAAPVAGVLVDSASRPTESLSISE